MTNKNLSTNQSGITLLTTVLFTTVIIASIALAIILVTILTTKQAKTQVVEKQVRYLTEGITQSEITRIIESEFSWPAGSENTQYTMNDSLVTRNIQETAPGSGIYTIDVTSTSPEAARRLVITHDSNPQSKKVAIVIDTSHSMDDQSGCSSSCLPINSMAQAAAQLVTLIRNHPAAAQTQTTLITFQDTATVNVPLGGISGDHQTHNDTILNTITNSITLNNNSNLQDALTKANTELSSGSGDKYVILFTDGMPNRSGAAGTITCIGYPTTNSGQCKTEAAATATNIKIDSTIFVISPGLSTGTTYEISSTVPNHSIAVDQALTYLEDQIASNPPEQHAFFDASTDKAVNDIFSTIYINNAFSIEELPPQ